MSLAKLQTLTNFWSSFDLPSLQSQLDEVIVSFMVDELIMEVYISRGRTRPDFVLISL